MTLLVKFVSIILLFANFNFVFIPKSQAEQRDVLVQVKVKTDYDDSDESIKMISNLIKLLPVREIPFPSQSTLSELILNEYRISTYTRDAVSYLPRSYSLLEHYILALNDVDKPDELKAGTLLIPYIPKKAIKNFNRFKPLNYVPKISVFDSEKIVRREPVPLTRQELEYRGTPEILDLDRNASQYFLIDLEVPLDEARKISEDEELMSYVSFFNFPMTINLSGSQSSETANSIEDHYVLELSDRDQIEALLRDQARRDVLLFIIDTGWPDLESYGKSYSQMREILEYIWNIIADPEISFPGLSENEEFENPSHPHCQYIARVLEEFRELDPENRIKVIYIPTSKEQQAVPFLEAVLQTHYLLNVLKKEGNAPLPEDIIDQAKSEAESTVENDFPRDWGGDSSSELITDKVILDALLSIGNFYARKNATVFLINESWTVREDSLLVYYPSEISGAVIAAAGNNNENINICRRDFAQRCVSHRDTVAVMNMDPQKLELMCNSSKLAEEAVGTAMAIAYDGLLSIEENLCGTSFAVPRVAWMIAAAEVIIERNPPLFGWGLDLCKRLLESCDPDKTGYAKLYFDPIKFLELR